MFQKKISEKSSFYQFPSKVFVKDEKEYFSVGTKNLALAVGSSSGFSAIGGGDTVAAANKFGVLSDIDYISTGGGAFLEFLQGIELPAITSLIKSRKKS